MAFGGLGIRRISPHAAIANTISVKAAIADCHIVVHSESVAAFRNRFLPKLCQQSLADPCTAKYASLWLYGAAFTSGPKLWLTNAEFGTTVRMRLGIPIGPARPCVLCHARATCDEFGDHALACTCGGQKTLLHTRVLDT